MSFKFVKKIDVEYSGDRMTTRVSLFYDGNHFNQKSMTGNLFTSMKGKRKQRFRDRLQSVQPPKIEESKGKMFQIPAVTQAFESYYDHYKPLKEDSDDSDSDIDLLR